MTRAVQVVRRLCPKARPEYLVAFDSGDALLSKHGINTPRRLAHFLSQVLHESGGLTVEFENMNYRAKRIMEIFGEGRHSAAVVPSEADHLAGKPSALAERVYGLGNPKKSKELGNLEEGDGFKYRGGGILQTTGRANYRRMGAKCGVDFESNPELVCSATHALKPALAEWTEGNLNKLADENNLKAITKRINGGYNGLADREEWFRKVRPLCDGFPESMPLPAPPDVEPAPPKKPKPAVQSKSIWAAILTFLTTAGGMLSDWKVVATLIVGALVGFIIWDRMKRPDILGWFK